MTRWPRRNPRPHRLPMKLPNSAWRSHRSGITSVCWSMPSTKSVRNFPGSLAMVFLHASRFHSCQFSSKWLSILVQKTGVRDLLSNAEIEVAAKRFHQLMCRRNLMQHRRRPCCPDDSSESFPNSTWPAKHSSIPNPKLYSNSLKTCRSDLH